MISCSTVSKQEIRFHYDVATVFYRMFWGRHIHHGLWDAQEPAWVAAQRLTETLAKEARIAQGDALLDVGCGMGGSSIHVAREFGCRVTGVTLSPLQRLWAKTSARWHRVAKNTQFLCAHAHQGAFADAAFDLVL